MSLRGGSEIRKTLDGAWAPIKHISDDKTAFIMAMSITGLI